MFKTIMSLLLFIGFFPSQALAQNEYIEYYNLVNEANRSWYEKKYAQSLKIFQEAFERVDYVHSINYVKAARSAAKLKEYELAKVYILEAIERGHPGDFVDQKAFKKFRRSDAYGGLLSQINKFQSEANLSINNEYQRKIDSLYYIDQKILRGNDKITDLNLDPDLEYSDSLNFSCLLSLIELYGFPSEQNIGFHGYRKSWVVIHHSARLPENHYYHPILLEYLKRGEYLPENYCWVVDQGKEINKEDLVYYHWDVAKNIDELSVDEKDSINRRRMEVGMPVIDRIEVVKKSHLKTNKVRW